MPLQITEHRRLSSVHDLAPAWQALHDASGETNPFSGPDWAITWLEHFTGGSRTQPLVLEVRDDDRLVGIAPLFRRTALRGLVSLVQTAGTGAPWIAPYELPSILALPERGRDVARAVVAHLCAQPGAWDFTRLVLGSAAPWLEPEWLPDWTFTVLQRRTKAAAVLPLDGGVDVYAGRRNLKESLRRARNRLTRDFGADGWSVERVTGAGEVPAAFDRLIALHGERAELREGRPVHPNTYADPAVRAFVRDVVAKMAARGCVSVYELSIKGEVGAAQLVLHTSCAGYSSTSGVSERAWPYSAVTYLLAQAVKDAQEAGHRQMNLSTGPNQAKLRWTEQVRTTTEFVIVGPRRRSQLLTLGWDTLNVAVTFREARNAHRV